MPKLTATLCVATLALALASAALAAPLSTKPGQTALAAGKLPPGV